MLSNWWVDAERKPKKERKKKRESEVGEGEEERREVPSSSSHYLERQAGNKDSIKAGSPRTRNKCVCPPSACYRNIPAAQEGLPLRLSPDLVNDWLTESTPGSRSCAAQAKIPSRKMPAPMTYHQFPKWMTLYENCHLLICACVSRFISNICYLIFQKLIMVT